VRTHMTDNVSSLNLYNEVGLAYYSDTRILVVLCLSIVKTLKTSNINYTYLMSRSCITTEMSEGSRQQSMEILA